MTINMTNMDEFGVLAESIGYKPRHGNSTPLAQLKSKPQTNPISNGANGVHPILVFENFDLDDIFYTQKNTTTGPPASPHIPNILDQESLFPFTSYSPNEDLYPFGIPDLLHPNPTSEPGLNCCNADDLFPGFGFDISTPTYDTRSGVNVSQPSSSPEDDPFSVREPPTEPVSGGSFPGGQKPAPSTSVPEDFISFEDDASKDRDGESDEQRREGLNSHMRIQERMVNALAEKRQRDVQILQEQEERSRLADTLDNKIRRWASGKEGNVRALLSSLQDILWPQSGWQMASLRDLLESKSLKKAYNRAIVYLHPDKAAQQGFSPEEKYIAEKVFYVLMEAYKVFQARELR